MKPANFSKTVLGTGLLALSLTLLPASLPAAAQTQTQNNNGPTVDTTPFQETKNDFNNLGWLGLIGLIGLANLFRKPHQHNDDYVSSSPDATTTRSTYRD